MKKIEHIGIAVKSIDIANETYAKLLGIKHYKEEYVEAESVLTSFFKLGDSKIELLQSTNEHSAIAKFIEKRGEGLHHIAFEVTDINAEIIRLKNEGFLLIGDKAKIGADNKLVCFFHPKTTHGLLVELCQSLD
ncbi:MAG: methylmalonyl-CoA epimerase [Saprospiraceae bacterium]